MKAQNHHPSRRTLLLAILLCCILTAWAQADKRITVDFKQKPAAEAMRDIQRLSGARIQFNSSDLRFNVTYKAKGQEAVNVVRNIIAPHKLFVTLRGKDIIISSQDFTGQLSGRERVISGYVRDESGDPLIGVPVCIGESRVCTVTDADGFYTFKIPVEATMLKFSYVGLANEYIDIAQGTADVKRDIVMHSDNSIDEVVVTGIFRKARESYTGSVSTITSDQLEQFRGQNLLQTLKNADVSINFPVDNISGSNPNKLPDINIRGNSSLNLEELGQSTSSNPNVPLIIMDGFEISLQKLMDYNDEEIESINILKDASATAIYGSRGANGVIVIISKQPEAGRLKINVEAGLQMEIPDLTSYHLLGALDKLELERKAGLYSKPYYAGDTNTTMSDILFTETYNQRLRNILSGSDTDWLAKPLRLGVGQRYNARLEGGSNEFRWGLDAQYNDVQGAIKGSLRQNFNGAITLMYTYKNLIFRNYSSIGINGSKESPYGSFSTYVRQQPYNSPYDSEGNLVKYFDRFIYMWGTIENPLYNATLGSFNKSNYQTLTDNFSIDWRIIPELNLRGQLGISQTISHTDVFRSPDDSAFTSSSSNEYSSGDGFFRRGSYNYSQTKSVNYNADLTLSYNKIFNEVHSLYAGLNWSLRVGNTDNMAFQFEGFANDDLAKIPNARAYAKNSVPSGSNSLFRQFGVTGNINYTYNTKYYVDLSYRVDGNSTYGSNKKYAPFWSAGIGWNIHNEKFLKGNKVINMLRLKSSYGATGSASGASQTDAFAYYRYETSKRYLDWMGATLGGLGNPDLSWQTTYQFNAGTEFGLYDNRIHGTFEVYSKRTDNLLSRMDMPLYMGFSSYAANIGEIENKGWEASLQGYAIRDRARKLNLMFGAQLTYNKNKIVKLSQDIKDQIDILMNSDSDDDEASGIQNLMYEGDPQSSIYAVRSLGIDPSTGKEIYLDRDGNKTDVWRAKDKVFLGSSQPTYRGNFTTMLQWKDLTVNVSFGYYWGGQTYNSTLRDRVVVTIDEIRNNNVDERVLSQRWFEAGDVTFFQKLGTEKAKASSRYVMDDNVLKLQSVSAQYRLHSNYLAKNWKIQTIMIGVNMNDLFYWGSIRMERGTSYPFARNVQAYLRFML